VVFPSDYLDSDVLAIARNDGEACVQIFFIRSGKMIGREYFILEGTEESSDSEVLTQFVQQFYSEAASIPDQMLLPEQIEEAQIVSQWLRSKRSGKKVELLVPREGQPQELVQMATENATETLQALRAQWQADTHKQQAALTELQEALGLQTPLNRIECYDVSHTQGVATVGAMIVFENGVPSKKMYRKFNIDSTSIGNPDDFASMEEMLTRRFKRWQASRETKEIPPSGKKDESFPFLPDLIIIDGGKGQLGRVVKVLKEFNLFETVHVVGLAKREEEIFFPDLDQPLLLPKHSNGFYLLQRIRDEAHRFGITAHRNRRGKIGLASRLDSIPGIGPTRRKKLLIHFGSIEKIQNATIEELVAVPGITKSAAESIKAHLD
jgi:excinuclease ABC subunit C